MKRKAILFMILFFAAGICVSIAMSRLATSGVTASEAVSHRPDPEKGFAIVELFTSEGCSSCPPADRAVARMQSEFKGQPVYILAFHVDYWNRLGWKDVFSDGEYTDRQNQYVAWFHLRSAYTPQVVIDGKTQLVGSDQDDLRNTINESLKRPLSSAQLTLSDIQKSPKKISLDYHTDGLGDSTALLVALVQKTATTQVKRGENAGATLSHVQIVRDLRSIELFGKKNRGTAKLSIPKDLVGQDMEVIAFLQNNATGEILAASKAAL